MFTSGFELTTALTNVVIFIVSLFGFIRIKEHKLWNFFFLLMSIDSFIGSIVHGIVLSNNTIDILWVILAFCFTIMLYKAYNYINAYKDKLEGLSNLGDKKIDEIKDDFGDFDFNFDNWFN